MLLKVPHHLVVVVLGDLSTGVSLSEYVVGAVSVAASAPVVARVAPSPGEEEPPDDPEADEEEEQWEKESEWEEPVAHRIVSNGCGPEEDET